MSEPAAPNGNGHALNPFSRRETHSSQSLLFYKVTTALSYLLLLVTAFYYAFNPPHEGHHPRGRIWQHNYPTPFAQSSIITSIYWLILFILQLGYAYSLYASNEVYVTAAANIGSHFVANNLLLFGFIHLWVRSHYWLAELLIVINFFNLSAAYFRHSTTPRLIHIATVSGPLAWNFAALYWVGAVAVHTTGVGQFLTRPHLLQLQWIFAFTIGGLLFLLSLAVALPGLLGRDPFPRGQIVSEDRERAPLLADD
ncbi:hypothetical protein N0V83_010019 [Neocucurbitaria cava]|uniref:DUF1774-domain-containing protein n=1 Tax=Neocucurbitaria cava TaxID=798079 RepID=A0A9W8Y043_9PLEO|nr:hypothetical protein N0V83_010019 [Neocucurbitaria cava]